MVTTTLSVILTGLGLLILLYGLYQARELRETLQTGSVKEAWDVLSVFIIVFILGYAGFLVYLLNGTFGVPPTILTAAVFFLGSVFVAMTAYYNKEAFDYE